MPSIQTESRNSMQEEMWLWVGNGKVKVLVRIRMLQRYKENVEEQKKKKTMLIEGQQCPETQGSKKAQRILITEAAVDTTWGSYSPQNRPF